MDKTERPKIIVIVGTNASGKSALGIELAKKYNGEIISADSRQVYKGFDLCCGKVTKEEREAVPHHLLDVCQIGEPYSAADYQKDVYAVVPQIVQRGHHLLSEISKQMEEYDKPAEEGYVPSSEAVRLTNAVNRGLERPEQPEEIVSLTESSEFLVTLFSSFAQAESESIGKNIDLGNQQSILDRMQALEKDESQQAMRASRQREMEEWLDRQELRFREYEDTITRRFVERITVVDADTIQVKIRDVDVVIERKLC